MKKYWIIYLLNCFLISSNLFTQTTDYTVDSLKKKYDEYQNSTQGVTSYKAEKLKQQFMDSVIGSSISIQLPVNANSINYDEKSNTSHFYCYVNIGQEKPAVTFNFHQKTDRMAMEINSGDNINFIGVIKELTESIGGCEQWTVINLEVDLTTFRKIN